MKRLAGYTALVVATVSLVLILWQFRAAVGVFFLSLVAAASVRPIIARLTSRKIPLPAAMLLTYLFCLGLVIGLFYFFGDSLLEEVERLVNEAAISYEGVQLRWMDGTDFQQAMVARLPPPEELYGSLTGGEGPLLVNGLFGVTRSLLSFISGLLLVLVLSIYWSADQNHFERLWLSLLPAEQRANARNIWRAVEEGIGAYMRSELIQGFVGVLLLGVGYTVLELPYPILTAIIGSLAWLVPIVGVVFALIPVVLFSLSLGLGTTLLAATFTLTVLLLLELAVEPRFFNRRRFSALLIVLTMLPMADAFGLLGLIIAPPLAAAIQIFFTTLYSNRTVQLAAEPINQLKTLEERAAFLRATILDNGEPLPPEIESMIARLESLLKKARVVVPRRLPNQILEKSRPLPK